MVADRDRSRTQYIIAWFGGPIICNHCVTAMSHSHCEDESDSHDHGSHSHDPPPDAVPGDSLYSKIDLDRVRCLNERVTGMAKSVIKPWDQRLDNEKVYYPSSRLMTGSGE